MGWPFLAAAKTAGSIGAALAAAKGAFSGLRGRFKATRGAKRRVNPRRANAPSNGAGVRQFAILRPTFPTSMNTVVYTTYDGALATATTAAIFGTEDVYKPTSCFDPIFGGASDQPLYWDQLAAIYNRYRVYAFRVDLRWYTEDNTHCLQAAMKVGNSDDQVTLATNTTKYVNSMPYTVVCRLSPYGEHTWLVDPQTFSMRQIEGEKYLTRGDDYQAQVNANPALVPYLRLAVANMTNTDQVTVRYSIRITHFVHMFERVTPAASS